MRITRISAHAVDLHLAGGSYAWNTRSHASFESTKVVIDTDRDLCLDLGNGMTIEDTWGGEIATAAIAHLAASTPEHAHFQSSAYHDYHTNEIATGAPVVANGRMTVPAGPGLGVTPLPDLLDDPLFEVT